MVRASTLSGGSPTGDSQPGSGAASADQGRRDARPHQRLGEDGMRVRCVRVESENVPLALCLGPPRREHPGAQFPRTRHPTWRHCFDSTLGPQRRQGRQFGYRRGTHQRTIFLRSTQLCPQTALLDELGDGIRAPLRVDDDRNTSRTRGGDDMAGGSQPPAEIGYRGRQRFGGEEGQLVHSKDIRTSTPTLTAFRPPGWFANASSPFCDRLGIGTIGEGG